MVGWALGMSEAGIQPESKEGLPLDPTVQLAMDWCKA